MIAYTTIELDAEEIEKVLGFRLFYAWGALSDLKGELSEDVEENLSSLLTIYLKYKYGLDMFPLLHMGFYPLGVSWQFHSNVNVGWKAIAELTLKEEDNA